MIEQQQSELARRFSRLRDFYYEAAFTDADFAEDFLGTIRRPVIVYKDKGHKRRWQNRVEKITEAQKALSEAMPDEFPENSPIFVTPKQVDDVISVQMYVNHTATNSRIVKGATIIRRTGERIRKLQKQIDAETDSETLEVYNEQLLTLKGELAFFDGKDDVEFRLRSGGHTDVTALITVKNGSPIQKRVSESGLLLSPAYGWFNRVVVIPPELKPQERPAKELIWDYVEEIPCSLYRGKIYLESDVAKYRKLLKEKNDFGQGKIR